MEKQKKIVIRKTALTKTGIFDLPIGEDLIFTRKNDEVINLFIINENKRRVFISCFNQKSAYGKLLSAKFNIDFRNI